ncbi:MAG: hypothetical protein HY908_15830 [Myxococcales bacterium]|nr:hypothetical protein [Myxococcales bacterium]
MQVDRSRFLALTAALATGCAPGEPAKQPTELDASAAGDPLVVHVAPPADTYSPSLEPRSGEPQTPPETPAYAPERTSALAATCRGLKPGPGPVCESFEDTKLECEGFEQALETRVAEKAVECLAQKSGKAQICDFSAATNCFASALRYGGSEPTAASRCGPIVTQCAQWSQPPQLSMSSCRSAIGAVKPERREALIACMAESCTLDGCYYAIRP